MTLSVDQRKDAAKRLAEEIYVKLGGLANVSWDDLTAAVGSIDDSMDALPGVLNAGISVKQNLIARLPEPFKSTSNATQKAYALVVWAMKEAGIF